MKKTIYTICEALFYLAVPLFIIFSQYHKIYDSYFKIGLTGIMLIIVVFFIFKKLFVNRYLEELKGQIINFKSDLKIETDAGKIANIRRELARAKTYDILFNSAPTVAILGVFIFISKALESELIKLSGALGFILLSVIIGIVFSILNARTVRNG